MKRINLLGFLVAIGLSGSVVLGGTSSYAEVLCTEESVAGNYGFIFDGFVGEPKPNGDVNIFLNKRERGVGTMVLDGQRRHRGFCQRLCRR